MDSVNGLRPAEVLLVEDDENDVLITQEGFRRAKLVVNLRHVADGEACMRYLRRQGEYQNAPVPDLILLDLNMPRMSGREVLEEIVKDDNLRRLPVVILTTSRADQDVMQMYNLRCSSYIVKPVDFVQFQQIVQEFSDYWFTLVVLPKSVRRD